MDINNLPCLTEIRSALPEKCFRSNTLLSLYFVFRDLTLIGLLCGGMRFILFENDTLLWIVYPLYAFLQGTLFMGLFVLGHDCGHGSFSRYSFLNYFVGVVVHSIILTPYTPWQLSHQKHHKNTGHIDNDEIFKPLRLNEAHGKIFHDRNLINFNFLYGGAWWAYLMTGFAPDQYLFYHYNPFSSMMNKKMWSVIGSLVGLSVVTTLIYYWYQYTSFVEVMLLYFGPLYVFAFWLVLVTFLHHNDAGKVKWYSGDKWSYLAGNLSTVDRSYGCLDNLIHHIGTHQVYHLFPIIPHYHLEEATSVFRTKYPHLVHIANDNIFDAFYHNIANYKNKHIISNNCDNIVI
jgi:acyl-lipid omega-3 desaturase